MIRKLKDGRYRLYSRHKNPKTGKRRNLGTFATRAAAEEKGSPAYKVDHHQSGFPRAVFDGERVAIALLDLFEQREGVVVVAEAHGLARMKRVERAKDCRVAEAFGDATGIERNRVSCGF